MKLHELVGLFAKCTLYLAPIILAVIFSSFSREVKDFVVIGYACLGIICSLLFFLSVFIVDKDWWS